MSEIPFSDQRPRTTSAEIPEKLRALKPLGKDPAFEREKVKFLAQLRERMERRQADRRVGDRREGER